MKIIKLANFVAGRSFISPSAAVTRTRAFVVRPHAHHPRPRTMSTLVSTSAGDSISGNRGDAEDGNIMLRLTILRHGQTTANAAGIVQGQQPHWPLNEVGELQARAGHEELVRVAAVAATFRKNDSPSMEKQDDGFQATIAYFWRAYSSDLLRAKHTAEIALGRASVGTDYLPDSTSELAKTLLCNKEPLRLDSRLREFALGVREGRSLALSWKESEVEWRTGAENAIGASGEEVSLPLRESAEDVQKRTSSFVHDLITETESKLQVSGAEGRGAPNVLLASHGGCIKVLLESALGFSSEKVGKLRNGSLTEVDILRENPQGSIDGSEDVVYDPKIKCWYRLGPRVNDDSHMEGQPFAMKQESHSLGALYGALEDDASAAVEK